jgi:hypothetical protein
LQFSPIEHRSRTQTGTTNVTAELQKLSAIDLDFDFDISFSRRMPGKADEAVTRSCISIAITRHGR